MTSLIIILGILATLILGFRKVFTSHKSITDKIDFAQEYRSHFIELTNKYFENYDSWTRSGTLDREKYTWLTKNVSRMQSSLGGFGIMDYITPFQTMKFSNYQIIINTIPKFRDDSVKEFDVNAVDDCLLRYVGNLERLSEKTQKNLKNPFIWFREGFREILSIPIFILNWFGIISKRTLDPQLLCSCTSAITKLKSD